MSSKLFLSAMAACAVSLLPACAAEDSYTMPINMSCGTLNRANYAAVWTSTQTDPFGYTMTCPVNNFWTNECNDTQMTVSSGTAQSTTYTFTLSSTQYRIAAYSFNVSTQASGITLTPGGKSAIKLTGTPQAVSVEVDDTHPAQFSLAGPNQKVILTGLQITVEDSGIAPEPLSYVFEYGSSGNNVCYRIPAIATAHNGDVIAVADYRYGGADIGFGRVSLHARISKDNGATWGDKIVVAESHQGQYGIDKANDLEAGFGDPAIVADRESPNVLLLSCCGNVSYPAGTWEHHQGIARFRSSDNGATWSKFEDMAPHIYNQFRAAGVDVQSLFIGSGRVFQSRSTRVGEYYRLYAVCLLRTSSQGGLNYVLYSDDFGETWSILGDDATPGVTSGDEPKAEELPDGSLLLSSRANGRIFNIFSFTDVEKGEGYWNKQAWSDGNSTNGTVAQSNSCNGEIMILPAMRTSDNKKMWLALQSVPYGPGRTNVSIYYKPLASFADYATPHAFANNWEGRHQASYMSSGYSTMTLQHDGNLGFLYEESTFGRDYTIVYKNYSLKTITDGAYTLDSEAIDPYAITADGITAKASGLTFSPYVGGIKESAREAIEEAITTFTQEPGADTYIAINRAVAQAERVTLDPGVRYILRNTARGTAGSLAMSVPNATTLKLASSTYKATDEKQQWSFIPAGEDGTWHLYNTASKSWVKNTLGVEVDMYTTTDATQAGTYRVEGQGDRLCLVCTAPANAAYPAIHLPANTARIVCWTTSGEASQWFIEPTGIEADDPTAILTPHCTEAPIAGDCLHDLQGRAVNAPQRGIYITRRRKIAVK